MTNEMIIDGEKAVLGRLASFAAKKSLEGNKISIVNADKVIITGNKASILNKYLWKKDLGGSNLNGPFVHANPEKILKRTIRGMLDYKHERGLLAFKRIKCYNGIPKEFVDKKMVKSGKGSHGTILQEIVKSLR